MNCGCRKKCFNPCKYRKTGDVRCYKRIYLPYIQQPNNNNGNTTTLTVNCCNPKQDTIQPQTATTVASGPITTTTYSPEGVNLTTTTETLEDGKIKQKIVITDPDGSTETTTTLTDPITGTTEIIESSAGSGHMMKPKPKEKPQENTKLKNECLSGKQTWTTEEEWKILEPLLLKTKWEYNEGLQNVADFVIEELDKHYGKSIPGAEYPTIFAKIPWENQREKEGYKSTIVAIWSMQANSTKIQTKMWEDFYNSEKSPIKDPKWKEFGFVFNGMYSVLIVGSYQQGSEYIRECENITTRKGTDNYTGIYEMFPEINATETIEEKETTIQRTSLPNAIFDFAMQLENQNKEQLLMENTFKPNIEEKETYNEILEPIFITTNDIDDINTLPEIPLFEYGPSLIDTEELKTLFTDSVENNSSMIPDLNNSTPEKQTCDTQVEKKTIKKHCCCCEQDQEEEEEAPQLDFDLPQVERNQIDNLIEESQQTTQNTPKEVPQILLKSSNENGLNDLNLEEAFFEETTNKLLKKESPLFALNTINEEESEQWFSSSTNECDPLANFPGNTQVTPVTDLTGQWDITKENNETFLLVIEQNDNNLTGYGTSELSNDITITAGWISGDLITILLSSTTGINTKNELFAGTVILTEPNTMTGTWETVCGIEQSGLFTSSKKTTTTENTQITQYTPNTSGVQNNTSYFSPGINSIVKDLNHPTGASQYGHDPDSIPWITPTKWAGSTWNGTPFNTINKTKAQICAFLDPMNTGGYVVRGLRELFYSKAPFANNQTPTVAEIDNWNIEVIRHIRNLLGILTPVQNDARLYLEAQWSSERKYWNTWDINYPDTFTCGNGSETCFDKAPGPCSRTNTLANAHCGDGFFPNVTDRQPFINGTPYQGNTTKYPELLAYTTRASQATGLSSGNKGIPWSIRLACIIVRWICAEGLEGHAGPYVGGGTGTTAGRTKFGCAWTFPTTGTQIQFRGKWR